MFEDVGEFEHVLCLLDDMAHHPNPMEKLRYGEIEKAINAVGLKVHKMETDGGIKEGTSYQSQIIIRSLHLLGINDRADKLSANLDEIKDVIHKVYEISLSSDNAALDSTITEKKAEISALKPLADLGEARSRQIKEWAAKGGAENKKYKDADHQRWIAQADELIEKNDKLSVRAIASKISKADKSKPPAETVRKYLATKWVTAL